MQTTSLRTLNKMFYEVAPGSEDLVTSSSGSGMSWMARFFICRGASKVVLLIFQEPQGSKKGLCSLTPFSSLPHPLLLSYLGRCFPGIILFPCLELFPTPPSRTQFQPLNVAMRPSSSGPAHPPLQPHTHTHSLLQENECPYLQPLGGSTIAMHLLLPGTLFLPLTYLSKLSCKIQHHLLSLTTHTQLKCSSGLHTTSAINTVSVL